MDEITSSMPSKDDCNLAMLAHLLGTFTGLFGALIIWLVKKDTPGFTNEQAKEALNFQITITLGLAIGWALVFLLIGIFIVPALFISSFIFSIIGAVAASKGQPYRYPFALRLVK